MKKEEFKDIKGFEGIYQISNYGNVRRLVFINGTTHKEKITNVKPCDNGNGYKYVQLSLNNKHVRRYVHRLVAEAFLEKVEGKNRINHKDYNRGNNHADNLEWCTQKENVRYSSWKMKGERKSRKPSNTGYKYIYYDKRYNRYKMDIARLHVYKIFRNLDDAIKFRDNVLKDEKDKNNQ